MRTRLHCTALTLAAALFLPALAMAQNGGLPPLMPSGELDNLVSRIALYPDPLLSQIMTAATYSDQIPDAAGWADEHAGLHGEALARAIQEDQLPWDPSVQALLPFPSVIDMMARDMNWTRRLGDAVLAQRDTVMDAVQRRRQEALNFGYLRSTGQLNVTNNGGYIEIVPVNPAFIPVPVYDPGIVYYRPRPGFFVGGAITFGGISLGAAFTPWGWGHNYFDWRAHRVIIDNHPWDRRWENRREYVHPYAGIHRYDAGHRPVERHEVHRHDERRHDH